MAEAPRTKKRLRLNSISDEPEDQPNIQLIGAIHVSPLPIDVKCGQLLDHFAEFGDVKELVVRHQLKNGFAVGIVTFEQAEDAKKALAGNHRVLGEVRNVSTAIANPILTCIAEYERPFKSTMALTDLPDDCLRLIFQMLDITDLCSIADTCSRFRAIRVTTLSTVHKTMNAYGSHISEFQKIVAKFGSGINDLYLSFNERQPEKSLQILQLSMDYCSFTLKSLTLSNYRIDETMIPKLRGLFVNLESLTLVECRFDELISTSLFSECRNLKKLDLNHVKKFPTKAFINCPPVECLNLILSEEISNNENEILKVAEFLKSQNKLRIFKLFTSLNQQILNVIIENCSDHLKSLHLHHCTIDLLMVHQLRILFSKLEELEMSYCTLDTSNADLFRDCEHLTKLNCYHVPNIHASIGESDLPHLECWELGYHSEELSENDLARLERFLKKRKELKSIQLDISTYNSKSIYEIIASKNVRELNINSYGKNLENCLALSKLDRISTLKIFSGIDKTHDNDENESEDDTKGNVVHQFIKNICSVEHLCHLELTNVIVDPDLLKEISKFKNLRRLYLCNKSSDDSSSLDLKSLEALHKLTVLKLQGKWTISDTVLINLVTKLKKLTILALYFDEFILG